MLSAHKAYVFILSQSKPSCRGSDVSDLKMAEWVPVAEGPGEKAVEIETEEDGQ